MIDFENIISDQYFYGHGKILLTGEYFVLDGAKSLALPVKFGQKMWASYQKTQSQPVLSWKSYDLHQKIWFEVKFDLLKFDVSQECIKDAGKKEVLYLQKIFRSVRKQNQHFLRENENVEVITLLDFPLSWGLGSSSSLLYNIAQWAYISPFELLFNTYNGSGYDIACAQSLGPIVYIKNTTGPYWAPVCLDFEFKDNLYFVYSGRKKDSSDAIKYYKNLNIVDKKILTKQISQLTDRLMHATQIDQFIQVIKEHEEIISKALSLSKVKETYFSDFEGEIKSLGAWGGDFYLVASKESEEYVKKYFKNKNHKVCLKYDELILSNSSILNNNIQNNQKEIEYSDKKLNIITN